MRRHRPGVDPVDRGRFPADPWRLLERRYNPDDLGVTESLFTVSNGYLGMRGNPEEGRDAFMHGTFVNGFHETWPIRHAEAGFGFARTGQTIVNAPDAKLLKLYVDDEPLTLGTAALEHYERSLDFRDGVLVRNLVWRTPSGKRVQIDSTRMVSMTQRHLAVMTLAVTMLEGDAPLVISSQLLNRQDGEDEYHVPEAAMGEGAVDPRKAAAFEQRVLIPAGHSTHGDRMMLCYRCANSGMTIAVAADHRLETEDEHEELLREHEDLTKLVVRVEARQGNTMLLEKTVSYHTSRGVPVRELSDRCHRTLDRARRHGVEYYHEEQRSWFDHFWQHADVQVERDSALQQAIRFNLFTVAQSTARADQLGVPAKGLSGSGYEGHYFWDSEIYVAPFLTFTQPHLARNLLHFRALMLPAARARAREMAQSGAVYPWRTINGEEASAYYAAGSAQVHIDADIAYALMKYVEASGDLDFLVRDGIDILVETARMWAELGFWRSNGQRWFHIHGVTGPDEYTTVVNNNLFTNVMARYNLEQAAASVDLIRRDHPREYVQLVHRLHLTEAEVESWRDCAAGMWIPFDEGLGIHPQDDFFLDREVWDLSRTPAELRPLLLHYHPLVIYRFQVLKQADVVLALFLQGDRFTQEQKRADFEYYDPITTGDSTLSAVVQSIIAAEVGYHKVSLDYFHQALFVDLADLHGNTVDGLHVASSGGVWGALVHGFAGMRTHAGALSFDPRLPDGWPALRFPLSWRGHRLRVELTPTMLRITLAGPNREAGEESNIDLPIVDAEAEVPLTVRGTGYVIMPGRPLEVVLDGHGTRLEGSPGVRPLVGGHRADGTQITAGVPEPMVFEEDGEPLQSEPPPMGPHALQG